jgi:hypothetical protein
MRIRLFLVLFVMAGLTGPLPAQDTADEAEPIVVVEEESAEAEAEDGEGTGAADARAAEDDDRFIPSREVPPDEEVIFPIDI